MVPPLQVSQHAHDQIVGSQFKILAATGRCPNLRTPAEISSAIRAYV